MGHTRARPVHVDGRRGNVPRVFHSIARLDLRARSLRALIANRRQTNDQSIANSHRIWKLSASWGRASRCRIRLWTRRRRWPRARERSGRKASRRPVARLPRRRDGRNSPSTRSDYVEFMRGKFVEVLDQAIDCIEESWCVYEAYEKAEYDYKWALKTRRKSQETNKEIIAELGKANPPRSRRRRRPSTRAKRTSSTLFSCHCTSSRTTHSMISRKSARRSAKSRRSTRKRRSSPP